MLISIFKQTLPQVWRNKKLWILGVLTSFLGASEETELLSNLLIPKRKNIFNFFEQLRETQLFTQKGLGSLWAHMTQEPLFFSKLIIIFGGVFALSVILFWLSLIAQGGIIHAASKLKTHPIENIKPYLQKGKKKFWPIFGINVISKIIIGLIFYIITYQLIKNIWLMLILFLAFIILVSVIYLMMKISICSVVLDDNGFFPAVKKSFHMLAEHWMEYMKLLITLLAITIGGIFMSFASLTITFIPFYLIMEASIILNIAFAANIIFILYFIFASIFLVLFFGFLSSVSWTAWTHAYQNKK